MWAWSKVKKLPDFLTLILLMIVYLILSSTLKKIVRGKSEASFSIRAKKLFRDPFFKQKTRKSKLELKIFYFHEYINSLLWPLPKSEIRQWLGIPPPTRMPKGCTRRPWLRTGILSRKTLGPSDSILSKKGVLPHFPLSQIEYLWILNWAVSNPLWSCIFLLIFKVFRDKFVEREILLLELHCFRLDKGCQWKGKIKHRQVFFQYFQ